MDKTIYFVRHCSTTGQEPDAPLTEEGFQQAESLAEWLSTLPIQRVVSSSYARAYQTAQPLARRLGLPVETDVRLVERALTTAPIDDLRALLVATFTDLDLRLPGGESSREAMARGVAALEEVLRHPAATTALVTHGNLLTLLLKHFDPDVGYETQRQLTNPDVFRLRFEDGAPLVERLLAPD